MLTERDADREGWTQTDRQTGIKRKRLHPELTVSPSLQTDSVVSDFFAEEWRGHLRRRTVYRWPRMTVYLVKLKTSSSSCLGSTPVIWPHGTAWFAFCHAPLTLQAWPFSGSAMVSDPFSWVPFSRQQNDVSPASLPHDSSLSLSLSVCLSVSLTYTHTHMCMHAPIYAHMYTHMYARTHARMHVCVHTCIHLCSCRTPPRHTHADRLTQRNRFFKGKNVKCAGLVWSNLSWRGSG